MKKPMQMIGNLLLIGAIVLAACAPDTAEIEERGERPGIPIYSQLIYDCNTGDRLPDEGDTIQPAGGCDSWQLNRYERPFNADSQDTFFPDLDILTAELGQDEEWTYFRLSIFDENQDGYLAGTYAIEIDIDIDGRGDVLVLAQAPGERAAQDWTVQGVQFWGDDDNDVGDDQPLVPDPPANSDGYDVLVFDAGEGDEEDLAWVRIHPGQPTILELAFKSSAIYNDPIFKWWAWSDQGVDDPGEADYHDTFDHPEAGDPILGQAYFPSQAIAELDNTCAMIWGAEPGQDPDLCVNDPSVPPPVQVPTVTLTPSLTATPFITPTPDDSRGTDTPTPSPTPCPTVVLGGQTIDCTPTPTPSPTPTASPTFSPSPTPARPECYTPTPRSTSTGTTTPAGQTGTPAGVPTSTAQSNGQSGTNGLVLDDCTPTPTPTPSATATLCPDAPGITAYNTPCTPTPTPSPTFSPTPTRCFIYNTAGQFIDCTPTPTYSPTPTECAVPFAFALVNCTPTPTPTASVTPTLCPDSSQTAILYIAPCTPTATLSPSPTVCVIYSASYIPCTPTPTPTECVGVTGAPCTPTPTLDPQGAAAVPLQNTNCRRAPNGQILDTLFQGVPYALLGRGTDNVWLFFQGPVTNFFCWAPAYLFDIYFMGQLTPLEQLSGDQVPYFFYPTATSTPTEPAAATPTHTPTCTPRPPGATGGQSGGC